MEPKGAIRKKMLQINDLGARCTLFVNLRTIVMINTVFLRLIPASLRLGRTYIKTYLHHIWIHKNIQSHYGAVGIKTRK